MIHKIIHPVKPKSKHAPRQLQVNHELSTLNMIYETVQTGNLSRAANLLNSFGVAPATSDTADKIRKLFAPNPESQVPDKEWRGLRPTMKHPLATKAQLAQAVRKAKNRFSRYLRVGL